MTNVIGSGEEDVTCSCCTDNQLVITELGCHGTVIARKVVMANNLEIPIKDTEYCHATELVITGDLNEDTLG